MVVNNYFNVNIEFAGTTGLDHMWYYPPTILDDNGQLWGTIGEHLERIHENRMALKYYYWTLQPDVPMAQLFGWVGHLAAIEAFINSLLTFYTPLLAADHIHNELSSQVEFLLTETNMMHNVLLALRV